MKEHAASTLFPLLRGAEFDALVKDIETHGQQEAIYRLRGAIIDGRNRLRACEKLGVKPWIEDLDPEEHPDPHALVMSLNFHRRHLRPHEKGAALAAYMQRIGAKKRPGPGRPKKSAESADSPSIASVAKQLGVAERTARDHLAAADDYRSLPKPLKAKVDVGEITPAQGKQVAARLDRKPGGNGQLKPAAQEVIEQHQADVKDEHKFRRWWANTVQGMDHWAPWFRKQRWGDAAMEGYQRQIETVRGLLEQMEKAK